MKIKICLILALSAVIFISGGCEEYDMPVDNDINITQTSETSEFERSTETEAYKAGETVLSETTESQTSEALSTQETSESPEDVLTVITGHIDEPETVPEELFKYTVSADLTEADLETLKPHKRISLMVEKEGIDISRIAELGALDELRILQGGYPGLIGEIYSYISDFSFLDGMRIKILKLDCGNYDIRLSEINLGDIEELELYCANILDVGDLTSYSQLKKLTIWFSHMAAIDPFCCLDLEYIDIYICGFDKKSFDRINEIKSLKELMIRFCDSIEIGTLSGLTRLETFILTGENISYNIEFIYELTWLKTLGIIYNFINDEQEKKYREINPECFFTILDAAI